MEMDNSESIRKFMNLAIEYGLIVEDGVPQNVPQSNAPVSGALNVQKLSSELGVKDVPNFSSAINVLKNPPHAGDIINSLTLPEKNALVMAFYLLLSDNSNQKVQILNQLRTLS
jgi:hypothetical protein